jgi:hypothetical protein
MDRPDHDAAALIALLKGFDGPREIVEDLQTYAI